jgi:DNA processing protein
MSISSPSLFPPAPEGSLPFPERLRLCKLPILIDKEVEASLLPANSPPRIALVGSRASTSDAHRFTVALARAIAAAGGVVVSGGALGIDAAAHEGALGAGGATWAVVPCGPADTPYPAEHASLFARVAASPRGRMIFAAPNGTAPRSPHFFQRNGLLVALSDAVVVIQAGIPSGALNAAKWATQFKVPLWAIAAQPWDPAFAGNNALLRTQAARPLWAIGPLLASVGLAPPAAPGSDAASTTEDDKEPRGAAATRRARIARAASRKRAACSGGGRS